MLIIANRENYTLVSGVVKSVRNGQSKEGVAVCNIVLEGDVYNKDSNSTEKKTLDIAFWNSDDGTNQRADRIARANVGAGSFITALVVRKDADKAVGYNFKYAGKWTFPEAINKETSSEEKARVVDMFEVLKRDGFFSSELSLDINSVESIKAVALEAYHLMMGGNDKAKELRTALNKLYYTEQNIFVGTVANVDAYEGMVKVTIPTTNANSETVWNKISFRNTSASAMADRAKKCLSPKDSGEKVRAIIVCGECEMYNDRPNYRGYRFDVISTKK